MIHLSLTRFIKILGLIKLTLKELMQARLFACLLTVRIFSFCKI